MKLLGELLIENNAITEEQLDRALKVSKNQRIKLGEALVDLGILTEQQLTDFLSQHFSIPKLESEEIFIDPTVLYTIPSEIALKYLVVPLNIENGTLNVATSSPSNTFVISELEVSLHKRIRIFLATKSHIQKAIDKYFKGHENLNESVRNLESVETSDSNSNITDEEANIQSGPVIKFVNEVLSGAVKERASDIHIEKDGLDFHIRYRIDGILKTMFRPKIALHPMIISRLKIMAKLDVSEHRVPQDGRILFDSDGEKVDFRVSVCPCIDGENAVLRILHHTQHLNLSEIGFSEHSRAKLSRILMHHFGLLLVAGQTGSGKTTTLYSILNHLNNDSKKIITVEDPVEIRLPMINQIQVNPKIDLTFASGLRSILRMDPDVILVGEIRDSETAKLAVNAAMTGHLVLSTIHCGNTSEIPVRLSEMGVEPYLVANVLLGGIAQRLVRLNCRNCMEEEELPPMIKQALGINFTTYAGKGCPLCNGIGYKGRTVINEIMSIDEKLRRLIVAGATSSEIEDYQIQNGMVSILESGKNKIRSKVTSATEVARVM